MNYLYLAVDIGALIIPFIFSFHPKLLFYQKWKFVFPAILISAVVFLVWDSYFTMIGVWGFTPKFLTGYHLLNLPLEEVLFFICIPYSCLFTYHCLNKLIKRDYLLKAEGVITGLLLSLLIIVGLSNTSKAYTYFTCSGLTLLLLFLKFYIKAKWLSRFYFAYLILLLPFLIVNGILTGTGLSEPVVWYNDNENLGIRLLTIPVEDVFYGMMLILLNVTIMELLQKKEKAEIN